MVEEHHPHRSDVDAGEAFRNLARETTRERGDSGAFEGLVLARKLHRDVDAADSAVPGDEAGRKARLVECDGPNPRALDGVAADRLVHEVADHELVAVGRHVLEVGDGIDAGRVRDLPGALGQPGGGLERQRGGGVAVLRHDGEEDVAALGVRILHRLEFEELRIVLGEVGAVVRRELETQRAARGGPDENQGDDDDRPPGRDDPGAES